MFTVLIKFLNTKKDEEVYVRYEVIYQAVSVEFSHLDGLHIEGPGEHIKHFSRSKEKGPYANVFIMNEKGHTVARYDL